ncbi:MAG: bifunctional transaldolase/phosoglucose isomerase [Chloroflexia bacterium]
MGETNLQKLYQEQGQAPWLDNISRGLIKSGELQKMIDEDGIVGVTSNPTIFEKAIGSGTDYDEQMRSAFASGKDAHGVFFELMLQDIGDAADHFKPVYDRTKHLDGYISIEVTPDLARDTAKTVEQAHWFRERLGRPNVFVKIPATAEGIPAIEQAIYDGISINVTLIFAIERYKQVIEAYLKGLERRVAEGKPVDDVWSVASFFVSRFDTKVDKQLDALIEKAGSDDEKKRIAALKGKGAIANAKIAYEVFRQTFTGPRWEKLAAKGAHLQRPLFASTSTKNPSYPDTLYPGALMGPDTVDTLPDATIVAFEDHGTVRRTVDEDMPGAHKVIADLEAVGISMPQVMKELEDEGVASFAKSYETLTAAIESKRAALAAGQDQNESTDLGTYKPDVEKTLAGLPDAGQHLWNKDGAWWSPDKDVQAKIVDRLGWLNVVDTMLADADNLRAFAEEVKQAGFKNVLLMGMGGSSLAPDLFSMEFETSDGFPELYVLDSTDPSVVHLCRQELDPAKTLYIVSSKSGTTTEPNAFMDYFYEQVREVKGQAGESFVAITDPGSPLVDEAKKRGFRKVFENPPDIGGRYSALSYFGLVPAALMGVDVRKLLDRAHLMAQRCGAGVPAKENPGVWLGAVLGTLGLAGRDKVTFVTTIGTDSFGDWAEQLIAESTGKQGKGLVPIAGEAVGVPEDYGDDRVFVYMPKAGDEQDDLDEAVSRLMDAGQPVITLPLEDEYDMGGEFFRWETAIAIAGKILGINPFDEPNVTESKNNTKRLLEGYMKDGHLPEETPAADEDAIKVYAYNFTPSPAEPGKNGAGEEAGALGSYVDGLLASVKPHDYVALLAYLSDESMDQLEMIRLEIRDELQVATTLGFGPRFLHSTGQLHKGGPNTGVFLVFTADEDDSVKIPQMGYSFGTLIKAQALGDIEALVSKGRRVLRLHLADPDEGMEQVCDLVDEVLGGVEIEG